MLQAKRNNSGSIAEDFAVSKIKSLGYKIITRNFHSRFGEIDIVATKGGNLVFLEVKARSSHSFGTPEEAVTFSKLKKIQKTGEYFSLLNPNLPKSLRIEVIAIEMDGDKVSSFRIIEAY